MNFKNKLFLAPMADVTSSPYRNLCKSFGADVVCTPLISATAIVRESKLTKDLLKHSDDESPVGVQLFGSDKETIVKAAKIVRDDFDFIDFNLGCPAPKVTEQEAGAGLLRKLDKVEEIISKLVKCEKPVTIKTRAGLNDKQITFLKVGKIAEECGVSAIALHARTLKQVYSGKANWDWIKELKENVFMPVIGNGDINSGESCRRMMKETGCDSVMIGRAAMGYPFIFREVKYFLENGKEMKKPTMQERVEAYSSFADKLNLVDARQHALWFTKGLDGSAEMRRKISEMKSFAEIEKYFRDLIQD